MAKHFPLKRVLGDRYFLDSTPFSRLLDNCVRSKSIRDTCRVHARIIKTQFSSEVFILNRLIDVYSKCDCLDYARQVFDKMPERNVFSGNSIITALAKSGLLDEAVEISGSMPDRDQCTWNSLLSGFSQHGRFSEALQCLVEMHGHDFVLNNYSFGSALCACSGLRDLNTGVQIHASISKSRHSSDVYIGSALIDMYSKCGTVASAQRVFDSMRERNRVSWNSLISCYEQNGPAKEALGIFSRMLNSGHEPDEVTFASVVSACASSSALREGSEIHARVVKHESLRDDLILGNALVDMYAKCGRISEARRVFDRMPARNVVSETSMVSGYARSASVGEAKLMFASMARRNVISWNALISGYTQAGENEEAVALFVLLKRDSVAPTHYTFGNLVSACSNLADFRLGKQAHAHVVKHGVRFVRSGDETDVFVGNSLIDMYMKCGSVGDGRRVFETMADKDTVTWNAVIVGFAQNGHGSEALRIFDEMRGSGEKPDGVTMIGVLSACSHAGLVKEGREHFISMTEEHGLVPVKDHYTCMVDLLGRAGHLEEAKRLIEAMPVDPDAVVWGSLLGACKIHRDMGLGKYVAEKLIAIEPWNSGPYVLLSNMYAEVGLWREVVRVRKMMKSRGVVKQPGCSWIEINGGVNVFMVKDKRHPRIKQVCLVLRSLSKQMKRVGYVPIRGEDEEHHESEY